MNEADRKAVRAATQAHREGRLDEAQAAYILHLSKHPEDAGIWTNLGALFRANGQHEQALRAQERAYGLEPDGNGIANNYANILSDLGRYELSIELRRKALAIDPGETKHHAMIGRCYRGMGAYQSAIDYLEPLVGKYSDEPEIELQLAFARLGAGQYGRAFRDYQIRWECEELTPRSYDLPQWQEGLPYEGKSILVLPEQGFGDAILFSRFVSILAERGVNIHFLAEKPVVRLFDGLNGASWVGTSASANGPYDYWMNLMDMPLLAFAPDEGGEPPPPTTLNVPDDSIDRARQIVAPYRDSYKVGVVWSGSATYKGNAFRSFSHRDYLPLTDIDRVQLFSLYKGPYLDALHADGSSAFILDAAGTDRDFADCAATMLEMDLVITSDTATAHIAGSLGIPVWTILHWDPFWVFRHEGQRTEWYPGMRLFRQKTPLDWASVFAEVKAELQKKIEETT